MRPSKGFTLLEVMLAFALLAVGLGLLLAIQSGGLRQVRQGALASEASLHAQSMLDSLGVLEPIEPGRREGEFDGGRFRWALEISEVEDPAREAVPPLPGQPLLDEDALAMAPRLYRVVLDVAWGDARGGPSLRVVTLRARRPQVMP
ncbi:MAG TPA: prepilin-type N-terminal cleavage/methylation domain-containing protein [Arenimonas sp.]|nr:prepilin-type N-terminal cleavage/methylation domain-containing protein [Arenimonas sp.]